VVGYLTDDDFEQFLRRCKQALREGGMIIIKDNVSSSENFLYDETDKSVCRSHAHFIELFKKAELELVEDQLVRGFPKELKLLPIYFFALR
jgi:protein N-terminal methyltransferase